MRILLLTVDFPPALGGIQNLLANLADGLAAANEVSVIAPYRRGGAEWDSRRPYTVTRAAASTFWPLVMVSFWCAALSRALRRPPDVVVCGHVLLGPVCCGIARLFGAPLVVIAHAYEIRAPRMKHLAGWTLRRSAMVVSVSAFTKRAVLSHGVAPPRVVVIHPGAGYRPVTAAASPARTAANAERIILTVARLGELYKGHDMAIRAMPLVLAREPNARYVIVGDGPLRPYLERLAASLGVARAVTFAGELPDAALQDWYSRADVFTLLSRESPIDGGAEGYGLTFIEAGAWQKPVVGGRSGGVPDAVVDGVTGLLVDPLDVGAIADALLRVLSDDELARRLGAQGRDRAVNELSWANFVAAFQAVLDAAVAPPVLVRPVQS
ncbi:MAG TPA: glycosyltransferase family 4 protein [Vicinamibacterales bacterium]|nr:glycosyltransferase family 4 protein [Vicinamibacterales bacterium]